MSALIGANFEGLRIHSSVKADPMKAVEGVEQFAADGGHASDLVGLTLDQRLNGLKNFFVSRLFHFYFELRIARERSDEQAGGAVLRSTGV